MDIMSTILAFENGEIETEEEIFELFQYLIDSGLIYQLQGSYQRFAQMLIDEGQITVYEKNLSN